MSDQAGSVLHPLIVGFLAEEPLHPGSGQSIGTIDLPVAREGGTGDPYVPGSSHKGALKGATKDPYDDLYGSASKQGSVSFSDLRLLLLPVRSSVGAYKWVTCPRLLERLLRDCQRCNCSVAFRVPHVPRGEALSAGQGQHIYLEELTSTIAGPLPKDVIEAIVVLLPRGPTYENTRTRLAHQLLVTDDDSFGWFTSFGLPVAAHNVLDRETKSSKNLWYEETLPVDTLLYGIVSSRVGTSAELDKLKCWIAENPWLQIGGKETVRWSVCVRQRRTRSNAIS